ncbi:MAG: hypothetical protein L0H15_08775 [Nitrosospira sp.]|nr:hypothetical protein [Nitrosospira sp.]
MITDPRTKRILRSLSFSLLVLGGLLMILVLEHVWIGVVFFVLGLGVEIVLVALGRRKQQTSPRDK